MKDKLYVACFHGQVTADQKKREGVKEMGQGYAWQLLQQPSWCHCIF